MLKSQPSYPMKLQYLLLLKEDIYINAQIQLRLANEIAVFATDYRRYIINDHVALLFSNEIAVFATV